MVFNNTSPKLKAFYRLNESGFVRTADWNAFSPVGWGVGKSFTLATFGVVNFDVGSTLFTRMILALSTATAFFHSYNYNTPFLP